MELFLKDKKVIRTLECYPPGDLNGAEAGVIVDGTITGAHLLSLIPFWAQKGYISIREGKSTKKKEKSEKYGIWICRKTELPENAKAYERGLYNALFSNGKNEVYSKNLPKDFAQKLYGARTELKNEFTGKKALYCWKGIPVIFMVLICVTFGLAAADSSGAIAWENAIFGIFGAIFMGTSWILRYQKTKNGRNDKENWKEKMPHWIGLAVLTGLAWISTAMCMGRDCTFPSWVLAIGFVLAMIACFLCGNLIHSTSYRKKMLGRLLGFREFIQNGKMPQLQKILEENPEYYYDVLPYAMATRS